MAKSITEHLREHLYSRLGYPADKKINGYVGDLRRSEWCPEFERHMRDRLVMGAMRYGKLGDPGKPRYDRIAEIQRRAKEYEKTGNTEFW